MRLLRVQKHLWVEMPKSRTDFKTVTGEDSIDSSPVPPLFGNFEAQVLQEGELYDCMSARPESLWFSSAASTSTDRRMGGSWRLRIRLEGSGGDCRLQSAKDDIWEGGECGSRKRSTRWLTRGAPEPLPTFIPTYDMSSGYPIH